MKSDAHRLALEDLGGPAVHRRRRHCHRVGDIESQHRQWRASGFNLDARDHAQAEIRLQRGFNAEVVQHEVRFHPHSPVRRVAKRLRHEAAPHIEEQQVVARIQFADHDLFQRAAVVVQVEAAQLLAAHGDSEKAWPSRVAREQVQHQPRLKAGGDIAHHRRPALRHELPHFGTLAVERILPNLCRQIRVGIVGEDQDRRRQVLVQVGRARVGGQRPPLGAIGRQQQQFGLAALHLGGEDGRGAHAGDRLGEDQVSVGEKQAGFILGQRQLAHAIAFGGIERHLAYLTRQVRSLYRGECHARAQQQRAHPPHEMIFAQYGRSLLAVSGGSGRATASARADTRAHNPPAFFAGTNWSHPDGPPMRHPPLH